MESRSQIKKTKTVETENKLETENKVETKNENKEVIVKQEAGLPANLPLNEDMGGGWENVTSRDFKIPIIRVLQQMSPEIDEENPKYVEGAKAGHIYNISTKEVYDGKDGIWLVPCAYHKKWVEFIPREKGGGYVDEYEVDNVIVKTAKKSDKGTNKVIEETGNTLTETGYFPSLLVRDDGTYDQVVLIVSSSSWNFAKEWLNVMRKKVILDSSGKPSRGVPPFWSHMYKVGSKTVKNSQFSWKQFTLLEDKSLSNNDIQLYLDAREFHRITSEIKFGADQTEVPGGDTDYSSSDEDTEY